MDKNQRWLERTENAIELMARLLDKATKDLRRRGRRILTDAASPETLERLSAVLSELADAADVAADSARSLNAKVLALKEGWLRRERFTEAGWPYVESRLREKVEASASAGGQAWLSELVDAVAADRPEAAMRAANADIGLSSDVAETRRWVGEVMQSWYEDSRRVVAPLLEAIAENRMPGWPDIDPQTRAVAMTNLATIRANYDGEIGAARTLVDAAVDLAPSNAYVLSMSSDLWIRQTDHDTAVSCARRAVEIDPSAPHPYAALGAATEGYEDFPAALEYFTQAMGNIARPDEVVLGSLLPFSGVTGLLTATAAQRALEIGDPTSALALADRAIGLDVRGTRPHFNVTAYVARANALEMMGDTSDDERSAAAFEAGRRLHFSGRQGDALKWLRAAHELDLDQAERGWVLADAIRAHAAVVVVTPDFEALREALAVWDSCAERNGPPLAEHSWAYVARSVIVSLLADAPDEDRLARLWEAVLNAEQALVYDRSTADHWARLGGYYRTLRFRQLALEAVTSGLERNPSGDLPRLEHLALLADTGRYEEGMKAGQDLASSTSSAWVSGVLAMMAYSTGDYDAALKYVEMPLAQEPDVGWYLDLHALVLLAQGRVEAAREDYRSIIEYSERRSPTAGLHFLQLGAAAIAVGDHPGARSWILRASEVETASSPFVPSSSALVDLAEGDDESAREHLIEAIGLAFNTRVLHSVTSEFQLLAALFDRHEQAAAMVASLQDLVDARREAFGTTMQTADSEISAALVLPLDPQDLASISLLATRARRHLMNSRLAEAADDYEALISTVSDRAWVRGLIDSLQALSRERSMGHDPEGVEAAQDRLVRLGAVDEGPAGIAVAEAHLLAGDASAASARLADLASVEQDSQRLRTIRMMMGDAALQDRDWERATTDYGAALRQLDRDDTWEAVLQIRLAAAELLAGNEAAGVEHVVEAVGRWERAGFDSPAYAVAQEVDALASSNTLGDEGEVLVGAMIAALPAINAQLPALADDLGVALDEYGFTDID